MNNNIKEQNHPIASKKEIGRFGELAACCYLKSKGFNILSQNVVLKVGEIDIVAEKGNVIHFVEVKSMLGELDRPLQINPEEHLDRKKINKLKKTALSYISKNNTFKNRDVSIDGLLVRIFRRREVGSQKSLMFPKNIARISVSYLQNIHIY